MPLYDLGYRSWSGRRTTLAALWLVVASTGFRLAWKSRWLRRLLLSAWLPAAYMGLGIFFFEKSLEYPEMREAAEDILRHGMPGHTLVASFFGDKVDFFSGDLERARYKVWAYLLLMMFRYTQGVVMILVVGLIAPPLIANDLRTRAYLIYFSRPLSVAQYLLGKSAVVWTYLLLIATLPALALFVIGVALSSDLNVLRYTWDLPLRILLASAVLVVPTTALALGLSSLFSENRYASASWFALWVLGAVVYANLRVVQWGEGHSLDQPWWTLLSLYHTLGQVQSWIFGLKMDNVAVIPQAILLLAITILSSWLLIRRVTAPPREHDIMEDATSNRAGTATSESLMDFQQVTRLYGTVLGVNDITASLPTGGYGLIGPNGAGKTTLLHLLMGLLRPTLGRVTVLGEDPWLHRPSLAKIGYCPSQDGLYGDVSAWDWVRYLLELHGIPAAAARERSAEVLEHVGLRDAMRRAMGTYSRGMRQRVKLAQALAHDPDLLILDEPFNGLDPVGRHAMTVWLQDWLQRGKSLILASHVLHEVESVTPSFLLICGGRLLASGVAQDVHRLLAGIPHQIRLHSPQREELASLLIRQGWIESLRLTDRREELTVSTRHPLELFQQLPRLCGEHEVAVHQMESTDDSLQSLFDSLFRMHRGEL